MKVSTELIPVSSLNLNEVTIDVRGLYKHYGKTIAIRGIDLQIRRGELFGLIGPNGAGKTTTFNILGGVMEPALSMRTNELSTYCDDISNRFKYFKLLFLILTV